MVKGILFDKDGTLIDFSSLWLNAALDVIPRFLNENRIQASKEMVKYVLHILGVNDGTVDPTGALAYKSYVEIAQDIYEGMIEKGFCISREHIREQMERLFDESVASNQTEFQLFADIKGMAELLKQKSIYIGLATADTMMSAKKCLSSIGVLDQFDYIGADDGIKKPKPEKDMFLEFQCQCKLLPQEIAVVGDTYNDVVFARKNGGIAIGVLSGVSKEEDFQGEADYIIASIQELPHLLEQM